MVVTPVFLGETETEADCGSAPSGISEASVLEREGEWEGKPVRIRSPRPSLGRGRYRQYLYLARED